MPIENERDKQEKLIALVREAISHDTQLREKYQVSEKFRFIRDRLSALLHQLEKDLTELDQRVAEEVSTTTSEDEVEVFVYLFNAQGAHIKNWQSLLTPKVFYEYSVNRPIYANKNDVLALIRNKPNKLQHAFLTIAIKREHVLSMDPDKISKDTLGNPLLKIKEGSLHFKKLISITHNENEYSVNDEGEIVRKLF